MFPFCFGAANIAFIGSETGFIKSVVIFWRFSFKKLWG